MTYNTQAVERLIAERDALRVEFHDADQAAIARSEEIAQLRTQLHELREAAEALAKRWGKHNSRSAQYAEARNQCARDLRALLAKLQPTAAEGTVCPICDQADGTHDTTVKP